MSLQWCLFKIYLHITLFVYLCDVFFYVSYGLKIGLDLHFLFYLFALCQIYFILHLSCLKKTCFHYYFKDWKICMWKFSCIFHVFINLFTLLFRSLGDFLMKMAKWCTQSHGRHVVRYFFCGLFFLKFPIILQLCSQSYANTLSFVEKIS